MEFSAYREMSEQQDTHWWFKGRRKILTVLLKSLNLNKSAEILEIGCGPGGNLKLLKKFGQVSAVEMNPYALEEAKKNNGVKLESGYLPDNLPFGDKQFDAIFLFDVLEHVEQDKFAIQAINERLKRGGHLIITVPALPFLFGKHDKELHHFRRYTKKSLINLLNQENFTVQFSTYFNFLLLPLAISSRIFDKMFKLNRATFINSVLYQIFSFESIMLNYFHLPIGLSICCVVKKNEESKL